MILLTNGGFPEPVTSLLELMVNTANISSAQHQRWNGSLEEAHLSWKEKNPGYEIRYYNLHYCRDYLLQFYHPIFLRAFDCIEAFAGKANLFRFLVAYREGGWYSDWKQVCYVDGLLDWLSTDNSTKQDLWDQPAVGNTTWFSAWDRGMKGNFMQAAFFGTVPLSPILGEAIRTILSNVQQRADLKPGAHGNKMTGIGVLGSAVEKIGKDQPGVRLGLYQFFEGMRFFFRGKVIILHKCNECGHSQNWQNGNNYFEKIKIGEYFCPDGASLFVGRDEDVVGSPQEGKSVAGKEGKDEAPINATSKKPTLRRRNPTSIAP